MAQQYNHHRFGRRNSTPGRLGIVILLFCIFTLLPEVLPVDGAARVLLQADNATCPLEFTAPDVQSTVVTCGNGTTNSGSLSFSAQCCKRVYGLLYQSWVRHANTTDQLLIPIDAATQCLTVLEASLVEAGLSGDGLATCLSDSSRLWKPACGDLLTTVSAFKELTNYSYPGVASAACWDQPSCGVCLASMDYVVSSLQNIDRIDTSLINTAGCKELAQVALVTAAYPITLANSIATCLWGNPVDHLPQAPLCTDLDFDAVDWSAAYNSCGPPAIQSNRCCDIIFAMTGMFWYEYVNRTGVLSFEGQVLACSAGFKAALAAHGLSASLYNQCQLTSFIYLFALRCKNFTVTPLFLQEETEAACAPGRCNTTGSCAQAIQQAYKTMAGPGADIYTEGLCGVFSTISWYGPLGLPGVQERINCYNSFPNELRLRFSSPRIAAQATTQTKAHGNKDKVLIASVISVLGSISILALLGILIWRRVLRRTKHSQSMQDENEFRAKLTAKSKSLEPLQWFSISELQAATKNFANERVIGEGGSGKVYLGELLDGTRVAIKEISKPSSVRGTEEFMTEVISMGSCRHRHILGIKGVHASSDHAILIYEYMPKGSLEDHLFASEPSSREPAHYLDWRQRFQIALGTAKGLTYLHEDCKPRIIHRDVKPSNILLDTELEAKVADFGVAKFARDDDTHVTTGVRGTWGYMSPEYVATGQVSEKSDVYAFGVVLLCLVTGRRPTDSSRNDQEVFLTEWAWNVASRGDLLTLVDPTLSPFVNDHASSMVAALQVSLYSWAAVGY